MATRVKSHVLEKIISAMMIVFGISAIVIFGVNFGSPNVNPGELAIIEILLIIVLAILAQTVILIRIYDKQA
ncbi:hypothetical protein H6504_02585 [Candidatus Woesearchaeota archaeon]|nr:hypothetical protein [Candidatus Woesearchaeota archaeon]